MYSLTWLDADRVGALPMGTYPTRADAEAAIGGCREILLGECADDTQRASVDAGCWAVEEARP